MEYIVVAVLLGLLPAWIAKNKGYSFGLWWFYGSMLFIVAIIHVCLIADKNVEQQIYQYNRKEEDKMESLEKIEQYYKELLDSGLITTEKYYDKMKELYNSTRTMENNMVSGIQQELLEEMQKQTKILTKMASNIGNIYVIIIVVLVLTILGLVLV